MLWLESMALTETRSSLPPLSALRAFEAAARYRNFTLAAQELNVTPSAVSHQMRQLEKWLGVKLFHRGAGPLQLTEDGSLYYVHLAASFDQLSLVTRRLMGKSAVSILTIATMDSFASDWLVPRLRSLREEHPELDVRISTSDAYVDFDRDAIDIAIRYGNGNWPNLTIELLFDDSMFAVCNPVLDQTALNWNQLSADNLIYFIWLEQLIRVQLNAGCSSRGAQSDTNTGGPGPAHAPSRFGEDRLGRVVERRGRVGSRRHQPRFILQPQLSRSSSGNKRSGHRPRQRPSRVRRPGRRPA